MIATSQPYLCPSGSSSVGGSLAIPQLVASVLTWDCIHSVVEGDYKGNYNCRRGGAAYKRVLMINSCSYLTVLKYPHFKTF